MKKVLVILLSLAVLMSVMFIGSVGAKEITETSSGDDLKVPVSVEISGAAYVVTIPESVVLDPSGEFVEAEVTLSKDGLVLRTNDVLNVKVRSENSWSVMYTDDENQVHSTAYYVDVSGNYQATLSTTATGANDAIILQYSSRQSASVPMISTLKFKLNGAITEYGNYSDNLVFSVVVT